MKPSEDLDSDLNWLTERHKPGYHDRVREQQAKGKRQLGDKEVSEMQPVEKDGY